MVMKKYLFLLACAVATMLPAQAQRLIPKQKGIEVIGSLPIIKGEKLFAKGNFGLGLSLTRYLKRENYAFMGMDYEQQNMPYRSYDVKLKDAFVHLGYMQPLLFLIMVKMYLPMLEYPLWVAMRNLTKIRNYFLMAQNYSMTLTSSMVERCIYP